MIRLARHRGPDPHKVGSPQMPRLSWMPYGPWRDQFALVCCAEGHVCALSSKVHAVASDGALSPSLVCPMQGCAWHVFARLDGWAEHLSSPPEAPR